MVPVERRTRKGSDIGWWRHARASSIPSLCESPFINKAVRSYLGIDRDYCTLDFCEFSRLNKPMKIWLCKLVLDRLCQINSITLPKKMPAALAKLDVEEIRQHLLCTTFRYTMPCDMLRHIIAHGHMICRLVWIWKCHRGYNHMTSALTETWQKVAKWCCSGT